MVKKRVSDARKHVESSRSDHVPLILRVMVLVQIVAHSTASSSGLWLATATSWCHCTTPTARTVSSTASWIALEAATTLATRALVRAETVATHSTSVIEVTTVCCITRTTFLHEDLLAANVVRVGGNTSVVCSGGHKFDKSAILPSISVEKYFSSAINVPSGD